MATNMPSRLSDLINWCNTHAGQWSAHAGSIGLSAADAARFHDLAEELDKASLEAEAARQASKDATMKLQHRIDSARAIGNAFIAMIKAFAETTDTPGVYALAGISPSDRPGTLPAPVPPQKFTAGLNPDGTLTIKWKVSQPEGVTNVQYLVYRRLGGEATRFQLLATEGSNKSFTDSALPLGVDRVEYMVRPKRGEVLGAASNVFTLRFGSVGAGSGAEMSVVGRERKLAA